MAKIKGIVLELEKKKMKIITEDGDFIHAPIPVPCPRAGETVYVDLEPSKSVSTPKWLRVAMVAALLGIFVLIADPLLTPPAVAAVAAVSMDLNSSVVLNIDSNNKVVSTQANNIQGRKVLQDLDLNGLDIYTASNLIAAKTIELGYLSQNGDTILVTVSPLTTTAKVDVDCDKLQRVMHDELSNRNYNGYLIVNEEQEILYKEAEKMHLTVNQYLLWKHSQEQNNNISLNDIKQQSVDNLIDNNETSINQMFPGEWCRFGNGVNHEVTQSGIQQTSPSSVDSSNPKDGSNTNSHHDGWNSGWDSGDSWSDYCDR